MLLCYHRVHKMALGSLNIHVLMIFVIVNSVTIIFN